MWIMKKEKLNLKGIKYKSFLGGLLWARIMTNKEAVI
jgi:hypothetical protein